MKKKKKEPVKASNTWVDAGIEYEHAAFMKRLKEVHGIDPKVTKGTKRMMSHMDGDTWYSWSYEWEIGGKKFVQHTLNPRKGQDLEIWSHNEE